MFQPVAPKWDAPALERRVLTWWREQRTFAKLVAQNAQGPRWSFFDGPITANNPMGVHHAWGRMYKDLYQRYYAMQGYQQRYQNGFDCQGLWVEVEVEKALGFNSKRDIEAYGLDNFARACKERVLTYAGLIAEQSERLGQWMHWDNSYYTYTDTNILYIWHFLKKCREQGWLYRGTRSMPWCTRCGTSLSQHEMLDSYEDRTHRAVFIRQPLTSPGHEGEWLLLWTTTPWTLAANVAAAVHPDLDYARVRQGEHVYYLSRGTLGRLVGPYELLGTVKGRDLVGLTFAGPFAELAAQQAVVHRVIPWDAVGEEEGVGLVHIAPGCGAEDFELSKVHDLPVLVPINEMGDYVPGYEPLTGHNALEVADTIFASLRAKGYLYHVEDYTHRYPVCWRCHTDLVFRVVEEWFIAADAIRPRMKAAAATVTWYPEESGKRMQDWLNNMRDWCISRKRFWGLPLPFYVCAACGEMTQPGSLAELRALATHPEVVDTLPELHRPWIDAVQVRCPQCGATVDRVTEVGDCWLDAGIVGFSTLGYLGDGPGHAYWQDWFPADWVSEMREQIRLWFYAMLFMSVTLEDTAPYRQVLVYEKVHDEHDRPMHKSHGNSIEFNAAAEKMGADVMRWIYAAQNVKVNLRFGFGAADEVVRRLLTLWNTYSFFVTYANLDGFDPTTTPPVTAAERSELDRWVLSRLHALVRDANQDLRQFDSASVTRDVEAFVGDLSNWYVRRSRRRFWKSENDGDKRSAYWTLYEVLTTLTRLIAPFMPFLAEELYQNLVARVDPAQPESVHLTSYPVADDSLIDAALMADVALIEDVVEMGRAARARAKLRVRQPLREIMVHVRNDDEAAALRTHADQVLEELNVKRLTLVEDPAELVGYVIKPNLPVLGPKLGKRLTAVRAALAALDPAAVAARVAAGATIALPGTGDDEPVVLAPDEVLVETRQKEGFVVEQDKGLVVALDTMLTDDLRQEGLARDLVRLVNELRKAAGCEISDRITTTYQFVDEGDLTGMARTRAATARFGDYIRQETLSTHLAEAAPSAEAFSQEVTLDGVRLRLSVCRIN
ncbi:MAG TPA: isoleucine--tRNA ligase [Chloroflexia bacterium]|nr:isoleucine--tRNA ligase [Chloroflexia bacterium]